MNAVQWISIQLNVQMEVHTSTTFKLKSKYGRDAWSCISTTDLEKFIFSIFNSTTQGDVAGVHSLNSRKLFGWMRHR